MEPVKKTEAPGYYQAIRFPMGEFSISHVCGGNQLKLPTFVSVFIPSWQT